MKLATERTGSPDGRLLVVSRDLTRAAVAPAATLQAALDDWAATAPRLEDVYDRLNEGAEPGFAFRPEAMAAPLPRAWQWLDGSAFSSHGALMQRAFNLPPIETDRPLMYQGMSHRFLSGTDDVPLPSEADGIDFEGELGIITDAVPMGVSPEEALGHIRLAILINDWSLRTIAPIEMKTGFGWIQAKPACSVAPVAVTLDELGSDWTNGRMALRLAVDLNRRRFGEVPASGMDYGFNDLVAHAARTRDLCAGTIIGSGTVSSPDYTNAGSCCIAERRAIEMIEAGAPTTGFMRFGDRVRMEALTSDGRPVFGLIDQQVVKAV
ncbi:fumarylacetoacetate hydrolase family protein [Sphingomonas tabacisoli]|uniref:Fumarylacetoacetate hydrolase family protein n=1 Tax=Sphingomonas tabacisoli TaxID=2249466 RepID=A0ABW4I3Q7_9SPHN